MPRSIPESLSEELSKWNNGNGIPLEQWVGCEGNFSLAVGYSEIFWPEFIEFEDYILRKGFSESSLRGFEGTSPKDKQSIEWVMNHVHIVDLHHRGCEDFTKDKAIFLGGILKEIYTAKLSWEFPKKPCKVELFIPEDENDLVEYQLSFWQTIHAPVD